jgi:hypothetical protein
MRDQNGVSKGSGFVSFSTREEASQEVCFLNVVSSIASQVADMLFVYQLEQHCYWMQRQTSYVYLYFNN